VSGAPELEEGRVAREVGAELGLRLWTLRIGAPRSRRSTPELRHRLRALSDRMHGARAIQQRTEPVPHAYRVLFRHVGLDPDTDRTPVEAATMERLFHGGFVSRGRLEDALTIAVAETGVPVWALDAAAVEPPLEIRVAREGERLGRAADAAGARPGRLVIADAGGPVAELFGAPEPGHAPGRSTRALVLYTVHPRGVPAIHVEEAVWTVAEALED
jgi:DNA/RNA-binding domain of Phe-tRNA-synthetase-like protein